MKDNFLLKKSQQEVFETLTDEEAGKLIKGIFKYMQNGDSELSGVMKAIFIPIKNDIDKNEERYKKICERNKENGSKGGRPKTQETQSVILKTQENPKKPDNNHISYITNHNSNNQIINNIIDYLNNKLNSKFKSNTKNTLIKINARLNEGYNLDDFIVVIDKKYDEWIGTEFEKYLCPETLFGNKFEKYLNQKVTKKNSNTKVLEAKPDWQNVEIEENTATADEISELEGRIRGR